MLVRKSETTLRQFNVIRQLITPKCVKELEGIYCSQELQFYIENILSNESGPISQSFTSQRNYHLKRQILRLVLISLAFYFIFPAINGLHIYGNFLHTFIAAIAFAFLGWVVESIAVAVSAILAFGTLGLALLFLVPMWLFGFWLLPAVALKLLAGLMPSYLTVSGWTPAILGGLIMLIIGIVTSGNPNRYRRQNN